MSGDDVLAEYVIRKTRIGHFTAEHVPSGILLHSRVNPLAEARAMAAELADRAARQTVLLGGGLGYLAEALAEAGGETRQIFVIEPDVALLQLARFCRGDVAYFNLPNIHRIVTVTYAAAAARLGAIPATAHLIVAPYFARIAAHQPSALVGFVLLQRTERASRVVYQDMLMEHQRANRDLLGRLPRVRDVALKSDTRVIVAGAGPGLDECVSALRRHRSQFILVAASGAVPPLRAKGITPDWVVALEGRDTVLSDLADLPQETPTIVFKCTHPRLAHAHQRRLFDGTGLETRGGTTLVPALDFALQCSTGDVILVGADLGYGNRSYASGAKREPFSERAPSGVPPKFLAMRAALENLLEKQMRPPRSVCHVLRYAPVLRGAQRLQPDELDALLLPPTVAKEIP